MKFLVLSRRKLLAEALGALLERADRDFELMGTSDSGYEGIELARTHGVDVALIDQQLRELNGIDATRQLLEAAAHVRVLVLVDDPTTAPLAELMSAGARGILDPDCSGEELVRACETVLNGEVHLCARAATALVHTTVHGEAAHDDPVHTRLTAREREVLQWLARGATSRETSDELNISPKTVDTHRRHIMEKLEASSVADLVKHAIRAGLTTSAPD